jgi:hypothetical protein
LLLALECEPLLLGLLPLRTGDAVIDCVVLGVVVVVVVVAVDAADGDDGGIIDGAGADAAVVAAFCLRAGRRRR